MARVRRSGTLLVALAAGGLSCVEPRGEATGWTSSAIVGGQPDTTDTAIVALVQKTTGTLCSGIVVAPTVVLTAAHCVAGVNASDLEVLVGSDTSSPDATLAVSAAVAYPTYDGEPEGLSGGVDLGAVTLATATSVTPAFVQTDTTDAALVGAEVTLVGYGVDSTTGGGGAGLRRSVVAPVDSVCSRLLTAGDADANECFGDSGGAVLLGGAVVAVISSGVADCTAPSNETRLSAHAAWVAQVVAGRATAPCPSCVAPDASCAAPVEGAEGTTDAGSPDASAGSPHGSGGCLAGGHGASPAGVEVVALSLALALARRRRQRFVPPG